MTSPLVVDCNSCAVRGLECGDCLITVLLGHDVEGESATPVELTSDEAAAAAALSLSGLVPPLRLVRMEATEDATLKLTPEAVDQSRARPAS